MPLISDVVKFDVLKFFIGYSFFKKSLIVTSLYILLKFLVIKKVIKIIEENFIIFKFNSPNLLKK